MGVFGANRYREGLFAIDWSMVHRILHSYHMSLQTLDHMKMVTEPNFIGPDLKSVEVNWGAARWMADLKGLTALNDHMDAVERTNSIAALREDLKECARCDRANRNELRKWMGKAQEYNTANIKESVEDWGTAIEWAKGVRNAAGGTLMVGATVLSGGSAAACLVGGSTFSGVGEYQDNGKLDQAVLKFTTSMVVGVLKVKGIASTFKGDVFVVFIEASADAAGADYLEGKTAAEAAGKFGLKMTDVVVGKVMGSQAMTDKLARLPIPGRLDVKKGLELSKGQFNEKMVGGVVGAATGKAQNVVHDAVFARKKKTKTANGSVALPHVVGCGAEMVDDVFYRPYGT